MQENFAPRTLKLTVVHRLDPRTKLLLLAATFVMAVLPEHPLAAGWVFAWVLAQVALARAWQEVYRFRWLLVTLLVFSVTVWSILAQGPTRLFWRVSLESLAFGLATFLKLGAMMLAGLVFLATTATEELFLGLVRLRLPYPVAFAGALALRWVPEIYATALRVKEAQEVRGLTFEDGSLLKRLRRSLPLMVPIFLLTLRRTQTMAWALEARGFQSQPMRTYLLELRMGWADGLALALGGILVLAALLIHSWGLDRLPGLRLS